MEDLITFCLCLIVGRLLASPLLTILEVVGWHLRRFFKSDKNGDI